MSNYRYQHTEDFECTSLGRPKRVIEEKCKKAAAFFNPSTVAEPQHDWAHCTLQDLRHKECPEGTPFDNRSWITWKGGNSYGPVRFTTKVEVLYRNGEKDKGSAGAYCWSHAGRSSDIVAFRLAEKKEEEHILLPILSGPDLKYPRCYSGVQRLAQNPEGQVGLYTWIRWEGSEEDMMPHHLQPDTLVQVELRGGVRITSRANEIRWDWDLGSWDLGSGDVTVYRILSY